MTLDRTQRRTPSGLAFTAIMGAWLALGAAPSWAVVNNELLTQACVGHMQIVEGDIVRMSCDGELTLSGGRLTSDQPLLIEGATALHLLDVHLIAPAITLRSSGAMTINEGVNLDAAAVSMLAQEGATGASLTVAPGAVIANAASVTVHTMDPTVRVVGVTPVGIDRVGGTISVGPGTILEAQDPAVADGAASAVVAAASAPEATPAAVAAAPAVTTSPGHEGGGGAIDGLGLMALAAVAGVALARARRV